MYRLPLSKYGRVRNEYTKGSVAYRYLDRRTSLLLTEGVGFHAQEDLTGLSFLERDAAVMLPVYARFPVVMERGEGVFLFDHAGKRYLDMVAGLGVNALGHAHPRLLAAMTEQAGKLIHL